MSDPNTPPPGGQPSSTGGTSSTGATTTTTTTTTPTGGSTSATGATTSAGDASGASGGGQAPPGGSDGGAGSSAAPTPFPTSSLNPQILGAVQASTDFVFGLKSQLQDAKKDGSRLSAGGAIAYEKAAQAASIAVQDAADYQRNVMSISTVAQGKALAMMLADQSKIPQATVVMVLAMVASLAAALTAGQVGGEQTKMITAFPKA